MSQQLSVAVLGAASAVGQTMLELIEERALPIERIIALGNADDSGETVRAMGRNLDIQDVETFDWSEATLALFACGAEEASRYAPIAAEQGCLVIDSSGAFAFDESIPLVCFDANPDALADYRQSNIVSLTSGVASQLLAVLKPLHQSVGVARANVAGYLSVATSGKAGVDELAGQTAHLLNGRPVEPAVFPAQIAFNVLGQSGALLDNGYSQCEWQLMLEAQRVLGSDVVINPTLAQVPVFFGDAMALHVELQMPIELEQVRELLRDASGVRLWDEEEGVPSPVVDANGQDEVIVARIRQDLSHAQGIDLWLVADNVRRGQALAAVQSAEWLLREML